MLPGRNAIVLAALVFLASNTPAPLHAAGPRTAHELQRSSTLWTLVPFGAGMLMVAASTEEATQRWGGALALTGLEIGPCAGYFDGGIGGKCVVGLIGRTVLLTGTALAAKSVQDSGDNKNAEAFAISASGLLASLIWAAHDIRRLGPLVEEKRRVSIEAGIGPGRDAPLRLALRTSF